MSYAENKKAFFDYQILEKFEAGIVLEGQEVKAVKTGKANIAGSYVKILGNEGYLVGATISPYQPKNIFYDYDPQRSRKLLLTKKELNYLMGKTKERGLTLIPLKIFEKNNKIKLSLGLAKHKKKADKRETIRKREEERKIKRELKQF